MHSETDASLASSGTSRHGATGLGGRRQRIPGHWTGDRERPTAERAATMSWYDEMVAAGRSKSLTTGNVRCAPHTDRCDARCTPHRQVCRTMHTSQTGVLHDAHPTDKCVAHLTWTGVLHTSHRQVCRTTHTSHRQ